MSYWVIFFVFMILSWIVSNTLQSRVKKYSKEQLRSGLTGKQIAEKMLHDNGIYDVKVVSTGGFLTDHYNPETKTVNLSDGVYNGDNVASAAVAAHECGHAVQHATAYTWLSFRSAMVPAVQFGANFSQWILLGGLLLLSFSNSRLGFYITCAGIGLFALTTLFAVITLPVEYNASSRALTWLNDAGITYGEEQKHAAVALKWAARTYLVAALSSLATLLYYIALVSRRN